MFLDINHRSVCSSCFADVTSATVTWDVVHTLIHLLDISNRTSFHQCPTESVCLVLNMVVTLK
jgi:hypothetical protein